MTTDRNLEYLDPVALTAWIRHQAGRGERLEAGLEGMTDAIADALVGAVINGCKDWKKGVPVTVVRGFDGHQG